MRTCLVGRTPQDFCRFLIASLGVSLAVNGITRSKMVAEIAHYCKFGSHPAVCGLLEGSSYLEAGCQHAQTL